MTHSSTFPFLTVLVLVPAIGAAVVALIPTDVRGHVVPRSGRRWLVTVVTLIVAVAIAFKFTCRRRRATSSPRTTCGPRPWASTGRWASTGSPCSWCCCPRCCSLYACSGARADARIHGRSWPGAAARDGVPGELRLARPHAVLPLLRADPGAGRTSSSAAGAMPAGDTRRSSSSSTPSAARPSCWWGSWPWPLSTSPRPGCSPSSSRP